jgi:hypothetical protein
MEHSETIKRSLAIQRYVIPIVFMIIPFVLARFTEIPFWYWLIAFALTSLIWILFYPKYVRGFTAKRISAMVNEGKNRDMLGNHSLTLSDDGIIETSENGESKVSWKGIERYLETKDHYFIYISSVMACIVPKKAFENEEKKNEFVTILKDKIVNKR